VAKRKPVKKEERSRFFSFFTSAVSILLICSLAFTFPACSRSDETAGPGVKKKAGKKKKKKAPAEQKKQVVSDNKTEVIFSYDSSGKPDPFVPLVFETITKQQAPRPMAAKRLTPLQKYDLSQLKLVAIISKGEKSAAVLEDAAGYGYIVTDGTLVGRDNGTIKKITADGVIVLEKVYDDTGTMETKISTLTIQHDE
jgi:type IV pilus assembly protein PilP